MKSLVTLLGCLIPISPVLAQERQVPELELLMQNHADGLKAVAGERREKALVELNRTYTAALERGLKSAQDAGKLEDALAIKNEATLLAGGGSVPEDDAGAPDALKRLRIIYRASAARIGQDANNASAPLIKLLDASLDQLITTLTKAGRLEDAVVVRKKKDVLGIGAGLLSVPADAPPPPGQPFTNSLGMKFVPVPGTDVLFCIHETRRADYTTYASESSGVDGSWKNQNRGGIPAGMDDNHPVVGVSWADVKGFCEWLSKKEGRAYRLPTDREWSYAVGVARKEKKDGSPDTLSRKVADEFPWDGRFPPSKPAGNYADASLKQKNPSSDCIEGYSDGFVSTAPVMSFPPNKLGLHDLGGNAWEWCENWYNDAKVDRVSRGGGWTTRVEAELLSSNRDHTPPGRREPAFGFRCVVEVKK